MARRFSRLILLLTIAALAGCTPDAYKRSADRQVYNMLEQRTKGVLDYDPETTLASDIAAEAPLPKSALNRIPVTVLPPEESLPIATPTRQLPATPLGPELQLPPIDSGGNDEDLYGIQGAIARGADQYRYGPPTPLDPEQRLDLFASLRYVTEHGRQYQSRVEDLYLAALDVTLARHLFEPRFFATTGLEYRGGRTRVADSEYRSALAVTNSVGVRQQLPYGGEIVAQGLVDFVNALRGESADGENAALVLSGSIPLLRGAGWVNLEPLISSERELVYQVRTFENFRRDLLVQVAQSYFNVLTSQRGLANRRLNYLNLQQLTRRSQALFEAGRINFSQVQRAEQSRLRAERLLVSAQDSYRTRLDQFKLLLGMPVDQPLEIVPVEISVTLPTLAIEEVADIAARFRLDLQTAADRVADAQRLTKVAENNLLPGLNLTADARLQNVAGTPAGRIGNDATAYSAGVTLDWPLDRLDERNYYRRTLIAFQRAQRDFEQLKDQVGIDARDALRSIRAAELQLRIAESRIRLARRQLDYYNELLKEGQADTRDVVEAQSSLLEAQDDYDSAQAQVRISLLRYLRDTGTLRLDPASGVLGQAMVREK